MLKLLFGDPLPVGSKAPDFTLPDQSGQARRLSDYLGKWVVLYFYPADHTFGCTREACSFRDEMPNMGPDTIVLGVSTDDVASHQSFSEKQKLNFPILADEKKQASKDYGVLMPTGHANRVTFIIDPKGTIVERVSWANWFSYGREIKNRLEKLRA